MNDQSQISGIGGNVPSSAVSIYGQDSGMDDFPVLKAFQQYIDAEQAKARKRIISLGAFFLILTGSVIAVFVTLLIGMSNRNQQLNDKILEYVMRDRERPAPTAPVVVQPPAQDNSALMALNAKLEEMQRQISQVRQEEQKAAAEKVALEKIKQDALEKEAQAKAEAQRLRVEESRKTAKLKEELETMRLKALLAAEREKAAKEKELRREAELEAYRRKHYPELYAPKKAPPPKQDVILKDTDAVDYFTEEAEEEKVPEKKQVKPPAPASVKPSQQDFPEWSLP